MRQFKDSSIASEFDALKVAVSQPISRNLSRVPKRGFPDFGKKLCENKKV